MGYYTAESIWKNTNLSNTTINSTSASIPSTGTADLNTATIIWTLINGAIFLCIIGGNTLTIIAVRLCRRLRTVISNMFIVSLAVSDVIVGLTLPYHITFYLGFELGNSYELCLLRFFLIIFACCVSVLTLISIAVDRYIAIVYSLQYHSYMTRKIAVCLICSNWFVGASVALIPVFWNNFYKATQCEFVEVLPPGYIIGIITPGFIIIWIAMIKIYWRIMHEASRQAKQLKNIYSTQKYKCVRRSAQIVVFIMACFSVCWLPYLIIACAQTIQIYSATSILYKAAFSLAMTNSCLNPIIYSWKNTNFRRAFVQLLQCKDPNIHKMCSLQRQSNVRCSIRSDCLPTNNVCYESVFIVAMTPLSSLANDKINQSTVTN